MAVYDDARRAMSLFGGNTAVPESSGFPQYTFLDTTWIYYHHDTEWGAGCA